MAKSRSFTKTLAILGGIFIVIEGILYLLTSLIDAITIPGFGIPNLEGWYFSLVAIVIGIIVLWSCDVFRKKNGPGYNGWLLLILGILGVIFTYWHVGGALVIIAGILWIVWKK
jgi:chromate transport protein ChrA